MPSVDWATVRKLVEAARRVPSSDRLEFLKKECGNQCDLLDEALSLLKHEGQAESFLEPPAPAEVAPLFREHQTAGYVGKTIGPFEIIGLLGYGGMGLVLRARQLRPPREVALKIVRGGSFIDKRQLHLFEREIRSLARLSHPAIAPLYEAGCTDDGQHYFAMELVQGLPLLDYANEQRLDLRDRLTLFVKVCDAVHYAHQKGVIHRDIKPGNILVAEGGQPKLLDFGLAKLLEGESTTVSTAPSKVQGTLSYMSPEQARGSVGDIDTRSDVYMLGVVLFELLTQCLPFDLSQRTVTQAIDVICDVSAPRAGALLASLRGDVETIVAKALEKDPERRYQSAHALAEDVHRFLSAQPITARPPSATYQIRKFAARHKLSVAFAIAMALVISLSGVLALMLSVRLTHQRDAALVSKLQETEARQSAEQVVDFLVKLFESDDPGIGRGVKPTVDELVASAATRVRTELAHQPLVQARLMTVLGSVYASLSEFDRSRELLESGLAIRERDLGKDHVDVAESLFKLCILFEQSQDFDRGYEVAKRRAEIYRKHYGENHALFADAIEGLGSNRFFANDYLKANEYFRKCLEIRTRLNGEKDLTVADALQNLGSTLAQMNAPEEAEQVLRRAFSIQSELHADPVKIVLTLDAIAHVVYARGDSLGTEKLLKEELEFAQANLPGKDAKIAFVLDNYATLVWRNRGPEPAEPLFREAMARYQAALGNDHVHVARQLNSLGRIRKELGDFPGAESLLADALRIYRMRFEGQHPQIAASARELGLVIEGTGRLEEAAALLRESYAIYSSANGLDHPSTVAVAKDLEKLYGDWNQPEEAAIWRERSSAVPATTTKSE